MRDKESTTYYEPLTPKLRKEICDSISNSIYELNTCSSNGYVILQKNALYALKGVISCLPDGYPIPMNRR